MDHIQRFLLEMGAGFAFVGRLVQQTTAEYLEERLGGHSVYAYNTETFGPDRTLGRTSEEEVVLTRYLRPALDSLNPGLPGEAVDNAIRAIVQVSDPGPGRGGQPDATKPVQPRWIDLRPRQQRFRATAYALLALPPVA